MRIPQFRIDRWTVAVAVVLSIGSLLLWTGDTLAVDDEPVCHYREGSASWDGLPIGPISAAKHLAFHFDDKKPGDDVPGAAGMVLDANCNVVESSSCVDYVQEFQEVGFCLPDPSVACNSLSSEFLNCDGLKSSSCDQQTTKAVYTCGCDCP